MLREQLRIFSHDCPELILVLLRILRRHIRISWRDPLNRSWQCQDIERTAMDIVAWSTEFILALLRILREQLRITLCNPRIEFGAGAVVETWDNADLSLRFVWRFILSFFLWKRSDLVKVQDARAALFVVYWSICKKVTGDRSVLVFFSTSYVILCMTEMLVLLSGNRVYCV